MIYASKNVKHFTYPSVLGDAESCWLLAAVKPVVSVAHKPQVIRCVEVCDWSESWSQRKQSDDDKPVECGGCDYLVSTNRYSYKKFGFSGKPIVNSSSLERVGKLDYILKHFNIISLKSFRSRAANRVSDHL